MSAKTDFIHEKIEDLKELYEVDEVWGMQNKAMLKEWSRQLVLAELEEWEVEKSGRYYVNSSSANRGSSNTPPSEPVEGDCFFNTAHGYEIPFIFSGGKWHQVAR